ncbi:Lipase [Macleaya cordata]|uniref:Lipase n=1 Tax=Macleaya cordata TaxID=56857 RepID=A0A200R3A9_MACCD|nr:Lipase [Macleaya cordata]
MAPFLLFLLMMISTNTTTTTCHAASNNNINITRSFPAILVFGDSTVDTGNNNFILSLFKSNHYPYGREFPNHIATGRFSNGRLVPDFVASAFGIKEFIPPYLDPSLSDYELRTGVSFASAGSGLDDLTSVVSKVIPMSAQPTFFKKYIKRLERVVGKEEANKIINGAFVVISAGSNDILFNFYDTPARWFQFNITGYQDFLLQNLHDLVKQLYDLGCRTFAISGLAPLGCVPIQITAKFNNPFTRSCLEDENADARVYNSKLEKLIHTMQASLPGSEVIYLNIYDPVIDMINNPQKYGFVETKRGCCGTGLVETGPLCNVFTPVCLNPSQYLFWDAIHPSEAAYKVVSKSLLDSFFNHAS